MSQDFGQCSVPASKVERLALFRQFKTSQDSQDSLFLLAGPGLLHIAMSIPLFIEVDRDVFIVQVRCLVRFPTHAATKNQNVGGRSKGKKDVGAKRQSLVEPAA